MGKLKCQIAGSECCDTCKHKKNHPYGENCKECNNLCALIYEYGSCDECKWERDLENFPLRIEWISVKDRLPDRNGLESDEMEYVIVCESLLYWQGYNVSICGFGINGWSKFDNFGLIDSDNITHWMPLPEPPEEE